MASYEESSDCHLSQSIPSSIHLSKSLRPMGNCIASLKVFMSLLLSKVALIQGTSAIILFQAFKP